MTDCVSIFFFLAVKSDLFHREVRTDLAVDGSACHASKKVSALSCTFSFVISECIQRWQI